MCSRPAHQVRKGEAAELPALFCESGGHPTPPAGLLCSIDSPPGRPSIVTLGACRKKGACAVQPSSPHKGSRRRRSNDMGNASSGQWACIETLKINNESRATQKNIYQLSA